MADQPVLPADPVRVMLRLVVILSVVVAGEGIALGITLWRCLL